MAPTVLICDDAIFMRTMVGDILTQAGFEVVGEAETGVQAVEKYKHLRPDLVTIATPKGERAVQFSNIASAKLLLTDKLINATAPLSSEGADLIKTEG